MRAVVAALGLAPAVITETLWALATQQDFIPTAIVLVTTKQGEALARKTLAGPDGWIAALGKDLGIDAFNQVPVIIETIGAEDPPHDIATTTANHAAADTFMRVMAAWTSDPLAAVHVSIAGGRKTMGFLAGYALSLHGRPQDRLSHVLINQPFSESPDFHFPPKAARDFRTRNGGSVSSATAIVELADIPFLRLRRRLPDALLNSELSFSDFIDQAQKALDPPKVTARVDHRELTCNGTRVALAPASFAFALWLLERGRDFPPGARPVRWNDPVAGDLAAVYTRLGLGMFPRDGNYIEEGYFREQVTRINAAIKRGLGDLADAYLIETTGKRPQSRVAFTMDASQIVIG